MALAKRQISLSEGWKYRQDQSSGTSDSNEWHDARPLPSSIYLDLIANGEIPDPFRGKNEELVQWVGAKTWVYEKRFSFPARLSSVSGQRTVLVFEGLDTYVTVTLNGATILKSDNMFLSHRVDVTDQLCSSRGVNDGMHTVSITFQDAEESAAEEMRKHPEQSWFSFHFGNKRLAVRKAQYHFVSLATAPHLGLNN
jgi:beta-mannosidase